MWRIWPPEVFVCVCERERQEVGDESDSVCVDGLQRVSFRWEVRRCGELSAGKQQEKNKDVQLFQEFNRLRQPNIKVTIVTSFSIQSKVKISQWFQILQQLSIIGCHLSRSAVHSVGVRRLIQRRFRIFVSKQIQCRKSEDRCSLCQNWNRISTLNIKLNEFLQCFSTDHTNMQIKWCSLQI